MCAYPCCSDPQKAADVGRLQGSLEAFCHFESSGSWGSRSLLGYVGAHDHCIFYWPIKLDFVPARVPRMTPRLGQYLKTGKPGYSFLLVVSFCRG